MSLYILVGDVNEPSENAASDSYLKTIGAENDASKRRNMVCFAGQMCIDSNTDDPVFNQTYSVTWMLEPDTKNAMGCEWQTASIMSTRLKYMGGFLRRLSSTII